MTASHLPYTRNGLKFFTRSGGLNASEVEEICELAARKYSARKMGIQRGIVPSMTTNKVDFMSAYAEHLRRTIKQKINHPTHYDAPLQGFKVN